MKFSTRARYGLRMMVELARLQQKEPLVQLKRIAAITGLSNNYLGQLAISLRDDGLLVGVSGKGGGYRLARTAEQITLGQVVTAVQGPVFATDCVVNPHLCLNADFCEARTIWALLTRQMQEVLARFTLADLIRRDWMDQIRKDHPENPYLHISRMVQSLESAGVVGCPAESPNPEDTADKRR